MDVYQYLTSGDEVLMMAMSAVAARHAERIDELQRNHAIHIANAVAEAIFGDS